MAYAVEQALGGRTQKLPKHQAGRRRREHARNIMKPSQFFSVNYQQARQKFLNAARVAGAEIDSFENSCSGVGGAGLFTDVASLGPANAENVLVLISGTHGV